jgi:tryptophanase
VQSIFGYTQSHIDYVIEIIAEAWQNHSRIRGLRLTYEPPFLRRFPAKLEQV